MNDFKISDSICKRLFESFQEPIYLWRRNKENELVLVAYNEEAIRITDGGIKNYLGMSAPELYKDNPDIIEDLNHCINHKSDFYKKFQYTFKSTEKRKTLLVFFSFIEPNMVMIYTQDRTVEEKIKRALKESEKLLEDILKASSVGIAYTVNRKIVWANESMVKLFRFTKEEQYKNKDTRILYPDEGEYNRIGKIVYETLSETGEVELDTKLQRFDGSIFDGYVRINFIKPNEPRKGIIVSIIDITKRKQAELKLKESEKRYQLAYTRAEFYKDIFAHDITNILQSMQAVGELLGIYQKGKEDTKKTQEILDLLQSQVLKGANLVNNIRTLSHLESDKTPFKFITLLNPLQKAIDFVKKQYSSEEVQIRMEISNENVKVYANELLFDVFKNLLTNSLKYNENETIKIEIIVSKVDKNGKNYTEIQFIDNGIGIEDERKENILRSRYSNDAEGEGMGLGLSVVKKILEKFHATIKVENRIKNNYKKGSKFIIYFPEKQ